MNVPRSGRVLYAVCQAEECQGLDGGLSLFCDSSQLLQNLIIIPAKPVDALENKSVTGLEFFSADACVPGDQNHCH